MGHLLFTLHHKNNVSIISAAELLESRPLILKTQIIHFCVGLAIDYSGINQIQQPPRQIPKPKYDAIQTANVNKCTFSTYNLTIMIIKQANSEFCTVEYK